MFLLLVICNLIVYWQVRKMAASVISPLDQLNLKIRFIQNEASNVKIKETFSEQSYEANLLFETFDRFNVLLLHSNDEHYA